MRACLVCYYPTPKPVICNECNWALPESVRDAVIQRDPSSIKKAQQLRKSAIKPS